MVPQKQERAVSPRSGVLIAVVFCLLWSAENHDILPKVPYICTKNHGHSKIHISTDLGLAAVTTSDVVAKSQVRIPVGSW